MMQIKPQTNLYIYDRDHDRKHLTTLPLHFFGSSSKGNSIYLEQLNVVIDLGFPYKRYTEINPNFWSYVDYLILTHEHSDHLNQATLMHILRSNPNVKILISPDMAHTIVSEKFNKANRSSGISTKNQELIKTDYRDRFLSFNHAYHLTNRYGEEFQVIPHRTKHGDIFNVAIEIIAPQRHLHLLYASDLDENNFDPEWIKQHPEVEGLPHDPDDMFNLIFLEANYDKNLIDEALSRDPNDIKALGNLRHISEQRAWWYVERHLSPTGYFIPLHASSMYGTLVQHLD